MKTNEIADVIIRDLSKRSFPIFLTSYKGYGIAEADVWGINKNGYMYEFEIKRSISDLYAEFANKKYKHYNFYNGISIRVVDEWKNGKRTGNKIEYIISPNRYFFACKSGLIPVEKVPKYAGLIYIENKELIEIKPAPLLHRSEANEIIYKRVAQILSQRIIFGCSYYSYQRNKVVKLKTLF